jgi:hypothetical protein
MPLVLWLTACNRPIADAPPVDAAKMEKVLLDMNFAETYVMRVPSTDSVQAAFKNMDTLNQLYSDILARHGLTSEQFRKGFNWYLSHPDKLEGVYQNMLNEVSRLNGELKRE